MSTDMFINVDDTASAEWPAASAQEEPLPQSLRELRPAIWTRDLIIDWVTIIVAFAAWNRIDSWWALLPTMFFIGSRQLRLGSWAMTRCIIWHSRIGD